MKNVNEIIKMFGRSIPELKEVEVDVAREEKYFYNFEPKRNNLYPCYEDMDLES